MAKLLLLQLKAAADRRHGRGPARRHSSAAAHGFRFYSVLCILVLAATAATLALGLTLHRPNRAAASFPG